MRRLIYLFFVPILLNGCVTTGYFTSETLAPETKGIALVAPDVELSVLNAGGIAEPHAQWTKVARKYLSDGIRDRLQELQVSLIDNQETRLVQADDTDEVQLLKLHEAVGATILIHQYPEANRLPSKEGKFEWSLGEKAAYLRNKYGADYALFVYVRDSYTSAGRAAAMVVAALLGVGIQGGTQIGFASLVDLNSGDIVWFNRLAREAGDLRTLEAARETVSMLLKDFPK